MDDPNALPGRVQGQIEVMDSGAICQLLAERFNALNGQAHERPQLLQWIGFAETLIQCASGSSVLAAKTPLAEQSLAAAKKLAANVQVLEKHFSEGFAGRLGRGGAGGAHHFLLQSGFSLADCMVGWGLTTYEEKGLIQLDGSPLTAAYLERLRARPAFKRAFLYAEKGPGVHSRL
eukprot:g654.t1